MGGEGQARVEGAQVMVDLVEIELRGLDDGEGGGRLARDLAGKFRADGAAAAGHQHIGAGQQFADRAKVQLAFRPGEQVGRPDGFQCLGGGVMAECHDVRAVRRGDLENLAHGRAVAGGAGDGDPGRAAIAQRKHVDDVTKLLETAHDRQAPNGAAGLLAVHIDQAEHTQRCSVAGGFEAAQDVDPAGGVTHEEDRLALARDALENLEGGVRGAVARNHPASKGCGGPEGGRNKQGR